MRKYVSSAAIRENHHLKIDFALQRNSQTVAVEVVHFPELIFLTPYFIAFLIERLCDQNSDYSPGQWV